MKNAIVSTARSVQMSEAVTEPTRAMSMNNVAMSPTVQIEECSDISALTSGNKCCMTIAY